ncbi:hypothetical protein ACC697_39725, partial [Rhizobium ruizarguesonis]
TFVVADLLEEGIVIEGKTVPCLTGRRPIPVDINYEHALAVGFKLMVDSLECVATDLVRIVAAEAYPHGGDGVGGKVG